MPDHLSQKQRAAAVFAQAIELHRAGQVGEAVELYRQALAADPEPAEAWRYLGAAERDCGDISAALEAFQQAVARSPENASYRTELATTLHGAGRLEEAGVAYQAALDRDPSDHISHNNLAGVLVALSRKDEAIEEYRKALQGDPENVDIIINLGVTLREAGNPSEAAELLRLALKLDDVPPRVHAALADACADLGDRATAIDEYRLALLYEPGDAMAGAGASLGTLLQQEGRTQEAFAAYREAIRRDPKSVLALTNLGAILVEVGQLEEALKPLREAIVLDPQDAPAHGNLGAALQKLGRTDEAVSCLEKSIELDGSYTAAWGNLGNALQDQLRLEDAHMAHARGLALEPENPDLHWNNAMTLLLNGDYEAGFEEYEWRLKMPKIAPRALTSPVWQGEDLVGTSILLVAEQGLGDAIQFARFASVLAAKGARVMIYCVDSLKALFSTLDGLERVVVAGEPIPDHDFHLPLMSTPHRLGMSQATIPGDTPYLKVPGGVTLPPVRGTKRRIGVCWSGNPEHPSDRQRSCGLAVLRPLFNTSDDEWVSLQFGPGTEAIAEEGLTDQVADWGQYLHGFSNTAGAVDALDLIISIDSSTAHLAGALGSPVWVMLKHAPDWRWGTDGDTTPWYPTMRLFRQTEPDDWRGVVNRVAQALVDLK